MVSLGDLMGNRLLSSNEMSFNSSFIFRSVSNYYGYRNMPYHSQNLSSGLFVSHRNVYVMLCECHTIVKYSVNSYFIIIIINFN